MSDHYLRPSTTLSSPYPRKSMDHIPIRSVIYRKNMSVHKFDSIKNFNQSQSQFNTLQTTAASPKVFLDSRSMLMSRDQSEKVFRDTSTSLFSTTFHKLSMGRKKHSLQPVEKKANTMNSTSTAYSKSFKSGLPKALFNDEKPDGMITAANFIEELKQSRPITRQFQDEVYDHYNSEIVINKPDRFEKFDQLADPKRYDRKYLFKSTLPIPSENEIREDNRLRFPQLIAEQENDNTTAAHFLAATSHNIKHVELTIAAVQEDIEYYKNQKDQLKKEMAEMENKHEEDLKRLFSRYMEDIKSYEERVKEDFIINQNENFKVQKEITVLQRDKLIIEKDIYEHLEKLEKVEHHLYGFQVFDLKTDDKDLHNVTMQNLRSEMQSSMSQRPLLH